MMKGNKRSSRYHQTGYAVVAGFLVVALALTSFKNNEFLDESERILLSTSEAGSSSLAKIEKNRLARQSTKFPPISCDDVFSINRNLKQSVSDPNAGKLYGRYTDTDPPFWISLHNERFDRLRWEVMKVGSYYENLQSEAFIDILKKEKSEQLHVVDVGGNIGWFSLLSVATALSEGKSIIVDVFEPNPRNRLRFCESLNLNKWNDHEKVQVNIYPVGVSSKSGGTVKMGIGGSGTGRLGVYNEKKDEETVTFPIVALDDLADELGWEGANILKVDVEGYELEVFQGAKRFLNSGRVDNIFFEGNTRNNKEKGKFRVIVNLLIETGAYAYMIGSTEGPTHRLVTPVSDQMRKKKISEAVIGNFTESLLEQCYSANNIRQCNLWWRPRGSS